MLRMVEVAPGVELEVIDWGGSGPPMVLLTGLGDNAHVYDQLRLPVHRPFPRDRDHPPRFLPSSQPRDGYDVPTRAADDIAVLDALGIEKAVFVGHSLAGSELSRLGLDYPDRVEKLVYLDASDLSERFSPDRAEPPGAQPLFTPDTLKSLQAYQAASARYTALREPDAAVCHNLDVQRGGRDRRCHGPGLGSRELLAGVAANPPTDWTKIIAPRLGIFAPYTAEARQAWYFYLDPAQRAEFDAAWPPIMDWFSTTVDKFAEGNEANTYRLWGAPHYVYINDEAEVVRWMWEFWGVRARG